MTLVVLPYMYVYTSAEKKRKDMDAEGASLARVLRDMIALGKPVRDMNQKDYVGQLLVRSIDSASRGPPAVAAVAYAVVGLLLGQLDRGLDAGVRVGRRRRRRSRSPGDVDLTLLGRKSESFSDSSSNSDTEDVGVDSFAAGNGDTSVESTEDATVLAALCVNSLARDLRGASWVRAHLALGVLCDHAATRVLLRAAGCDAVLPAVAALAADEAYTKQQQMRQQRTWHATDEHVQRSELSISGAHGWLRTGVRQRALLALRVIGDVQLQTADANQSASADANLSMVSSTVTASFPHKIPSVFYSDANINSARSALGSSDPTLMLAGLAIVRRLARRDVSPDVRMLQSDLIPVLCDILVQFAERRLPAAYFRRGVCHPFAQIQLIQTLGLLVSTCSLCGCISCMYGPYHDETDAVDRRCRVAECAIRREESIQRCSAAVLVAAREGESVRTYAGYAVVVETVRFAASLSQLCSSCACLASGGLRCAARSPFDQLIAGAEVSTESFLSSTLPNLVLLGLDCLARLFCASIASTGPGSNASVRSLASRHRELIVASLDDPDIAFRAAALDVVGCLVTADNAYAVLQRTADCAVMAAVGTLNSIHQLAPLYMSVCARACELTLTIAERQLSSLTSVSVLDLILRLAQAQHHHRIPLSYCSFRICMHAGKLLAKLVISSVQDSPAIPTELQILKGVLQMATDDKIVINSAVAIFLVRTLNMWARSLSATRSTSIKSWLNSTAAMLTDLCLREPSDWCVGVAIADLEMLLIDTLVLFCATAVQSCGDEHVLSACSCGAGPLWRIARQSLFCVSQRATASKIRIWAGMAHGLTENDLQNWNITETTNVKTEPFKHSTTELLDETAKKSTPTWIRKVKEFYDQQRTSQEHETASDHIEDISQTKNEPPLSRAKQEPLLRTGDISIRSLSSDGQIVAKQSAPLENNHVVLDKTLGPIWDVQGRVRSPGPTIPTNQVSHLAPARTHRQLSEEQAALDRELFGKTESE